MPLLRHLLLVLLLLLLFFSPCPATAVEAGNPGAFPDLLSDELEFGDDDKEWSGTGISDPLEPVNRVFFEVNDRLYFWLMKPVAEGYAWLLPFELRQCFGNFFANIASPIRFLNAVLQFDLEESGVILSRFVINSTLGIYGLFDVAQSEFALSARHADFGQTLGKWGLGEGIFLYWPIFGPSSVRDSIGLLVDISSHPVPYLQDDLLLNTTYFGTERVNTLSLNPRMYEDLKRYSLDPYVSARQAYYEYRKHLVDH